MSNGSMKTMLTVQVNRNLTAVQLHVFSVEIGVSIIARINYYGRSSILSGIKLISLYLKFSVMCDDITVSIETHEV